MNAFLFFHFNLFIFILVDISIYKDEDQLKELERRKRIEERKKSKKGRQKNNLGVNKSNSINDDTASKKASHSTEGGKQECIDDDDEKPDLSKDNLSNTLRRAQNSILSKNGFDLCWKIRLGLWVYLQKTTIGLILRFHSKILKLIFPYF